MAYGLQNEGVSSSKTGDESFVAILQKHNPAELEGFCAHYRGLLHTVAMSVVHNHLDAEEVLQDVFLHVWNSAEIYSPEKGKITGWMVMLTRRRAIDRLRKINSYRRATERYEVEFQPERQQAGSEEAARADLLSLLQKQLQRLPPAQREVLELNFFKGMSQRQIATATRIPLGTIKTRIELGLRKMSHMLMTARL